MILNHIVKTNANFSNEILRIDLQTRKQCMTLKSQEREHFPNVHFFYFILIEIGSQLSKFQKLSFDHRSTIKWSFKIISPFLQKYVPQQKKGFIINVK